MEEHGKPENRAQQQQGLRGTGSTAWAQFPFHGSRHARPQPESSTRDAHRQLSDNADSFFFLLLLCGENRGEDHEASSVHPGTEPHKNQESLKMLEPIPGLWSYSQRQTFLSTSFNARCYSVEEFLLDRIWKNTRFSPKFGRLHVPQSSAAQSFSSLGSPHSDDVCGPGRSGGSFLW